MVEARVAARGKPKGDVLVVPERVCERSSHLVRVSEVLIPEGTFLLRAGGARRKASGSYYTPSPLAAVMVEKALHPLVEPILEGCARRDAGGRPERSPEEILDLTV